MNFEETCARQQSMLKLRGILVASEEDWLRGKSGHSIEEVSEMMRAAVREGTDGQRE